MGNLDGLMITNAYVRVEEGPAPATTQAENTPIFQNAFVVY